MAIRFYNEGNDYRFPAKRIVTRWLREVAAAEGDRIGDINYIFCSSEYHRDINRQFLGHDYFTDVITFDESDRRESRIVGGEVYIDVDTVIDNARIYRAIPTTEMRRVVVHGLLHLCGQRDKSVSASVMMRRKENRYLKSLNRMLCDPRNDD